FARASLAKQGALYSLDRLAVLLPLVLPNYLLLAPTHSSELMLLPTCSPRLGPFLLSRERSLLDCLYSNYPCLLRSLHLNHLGFLLPSFAFLLSFLPRVFPPEKYEDLCWMGDVPSDPLSLTTCRTLLILPFFPLPANPFFCALTSPCKKMTRTPLCLCASVPLCLLSRLKQLAMV